MGDLQGQDLSRLAPETNDTVDFDEIEALAAVLRNSPVLIDLEVRRGDSLLRLRRPLPSVASSPQQQQRARTGGSSTPSKAEGAATTGEAAVVAAATAAPDVPPAADNGNGAARFLASMNLSAVIPSSGAEAYAVAVKAGLVGIFRAGHPPLAVGDSVRESQIVGQIEAMRLMNECFAPRAGVVATVLVEDGQPVEYGQPLFQIMPEPARSAP